MAGQGPEWLGSMMGAMGETLLDAAGMRRTLSRVASEILDDNAGCEDLVVVGILSRGYPVAKRLAFTITQIEGETVPVGKLDASAFRDDVAGTGEDESEIPFRITGKTVVLVDEVIFTGRTIRAALEALMRFGRPEKVLLAVLVDRGYRELPIQPDYVGRKVDTERDDHVLVKVNEIDGEDAVELIGAQEREALA